jgi:hypothetical protein
MEVVDNNLEFLLANQSFIRMSSFQFDESVKLCCAIFCSSCFLHWIDGFWVYVRNLFIFAFIMPILLLLQLIILSGSCILYVIMLYHLSISSLSWNVVPNIQWKYLCFQYPMHSCNWVMSIDPYDSFLYFWMCSWRKPRCGELLIVKENLSI